MLQNSVILHFPVILQFLVISWTVHVDDIKQSREKNYSGFRHASNSNINYKTLVLHMKLEYNLL